MASLLGKSKSVCLHLPKTGTSWCERLFRQHREELGYTEFLSKHSVMAETVAELNKNSIEKVKRSQYKFFTFVRNPASWIESIWFGCKSRKKRVSQKYFSGKFEEQLVSWPIMACIEERGIDSFTSRLLEKFPNFISTVYGNYTLGCDFVGKQENLREDLENIFLSLGVEEECVYRKIADLPDYNKKEDKLKLSEKSRNLILENTKDLCYKYNYD